MSRLTDLIQQVQKTDPQLASSLHAEYDARNDRRAFGLNFERHTAETVELPGRPIRSGDKVRFLPERDADKEAIKKLDANIWTVSGLRGKGETRTAALTCQIVAPGCGVTLIYGRFGGCHNRPQS
jgi:adenine-specific DNA-methyltransferase